MKSGFLELLRSNRNYRYTWMGQVVSEIGDHFNNIAVFSLAVERTGSGLVVTGIMLARGLAVVLAGPLAGVLLDRMDRKRLMIASDLVRAGLAALFLLTVRHPEPWLLYLLSGLLMFASPFFTSGRAALLPVIATREELHTANALTQTTQWATLTIGTMTAGWSAAALGYHWAFLINAFSFVVSACCIARLRAPRGRFRARSTALTETEVLRPWQEYREGLRYMRASPLIFGIALLHVGWASGGGAAQILFSLFGEIVFRRGAAGIGVIWGFAGLGLLAGGAIGHRLGKRLSFAGYKRTVALCYLIHGGAYVVFSLMERFWAALLFIALSRAAVGVTSVLNYSQLLRHVSDAFRGRVFATIESLTWATMMASMLGAGLASTLTDPRTIGVCSGLLSSSTALFWLWADRTGRLPEPPEVGVQPEEVEVHGEPTV
ncbi:MAG: MFS transporter [Bryobacterales bacterium]|nr:MFS transporter [Bryobacteraceae bacterium]MDW8355655.1 MFS transporter [Bryobacterales bacterium]